MAGKHDPSTRFISFAVKRELWYRLTQCAEGLGISRNLFVNRLFENEMNRLGVKITPENKAKAEAETKAIRESRRQTWEVQDK